MKAVLVRISCEKVVNLIQAHHAKNPLLCCRRRRIRLRGWGQRPDGKGHGKDDRGEEVEEGEQAHRVMIS